MLSSKETISIGDEHSGQIKKSLSEQSSISEILSISCFSFVFLIDSIIVNQNIILLLLRINYFIENRKIIKSFER